jgi:hypothetical protein
VVGRCSGSGDAAQVKERRCSVREEQGLGGGGGEGAFIGGEGRGGARLRRWRKGSVAAGHDWWSSVGWLLQERKGRGGGAGA